MVSIKSVIKIKFAALKIMSARRFVITGGPGFGKTTIIDALQARGFHCFSEFSRSIIREQLEIGGDILPWKNLESFSRLVFDKRIKQFEEAPEKKVSFFDRGIPDVIAYLNKDGIELNQHYVEALGNFNYETNVFLTPPWESIFVNDSERVENFTEAKIAHEHIKFTYNQLGYKTFDIPCLPVEERVQFIIDNI